MDNVMDFRVRTAGIWRILGFARLELAFLKKIRHLFLFLWWRIGLVGWIKHHQTTTSLKLSVPSKRFFLHLLKSVPLTERIYG
jgi:hypothetical protein